MPNPEGEAPNLTELEWKKEINGRHFFVSTSRQTLDETFVNKAFDSDDMPWARSLSTVQLKKMLDNSLTFSLYEKILSKDGLHDGASSMIGSQHTLKQIGMARLIADHITFAYLTDVYIVAEFRRFGLARWLMACCREVFESMPAIRRGFLVTSLSYGAEFYKETLGFYNMVEEAPLVALTGKFGRNAEDHQH